MSEGGEARNHEEWWQDFKRRWDAAHPEARNHVWLCPVHADEFWVPHGGVCPEMGCTVELVRYDRAYGEARNHEAEIEAVARAIAGSNSDRPVLDVERPAAERAIAALDAVRRSPQGVKIPPLCDRCGGDHYITEHDEATRRHPPQGEDHEAGIEAFCEVLFRWQPPLRDILDDTALEEAIAAYLSRCPSPERDTEKEN